MRQWVCGGLVVGLMGCVEVVEDKGDAGVGVLNGSSSAAMNMGSGSSVNMGSGSSMSMGTSAMSM